MRGLRLRAAALAALLVPWPCLAEPYRPLEHLEAGISDVPTSENAWIFGAGSAATLLALTLDDSVKRGFAGGDRLGGWERIGNLWGSGAASVGIAAGSLAMGLIFAKPHEVDAGEAHLEALLVDVLLITSLKYSVRRERPDGSDDLSFPSGHSSAAFTTAGSLMEMYGPGVGIPAIGMGVFTMLSRMASRKHHLSDTLFGATIGYVAGRSFAQHHLHRETREKTGALSLQILPSFESRSELGLVARLCF